MAGRWVIEDAAQTSATQQPPPQEGGSRWVVEEDPAQPQRIKKTGPDGAVFEFPAGTNERNQRRIMAEYYQRKSPGYQAARRDAQRVNTARRANPLEGTPLQFVGDANNALGEWTDQVIASTGASDEIAGGAAYLATAADNLIRGGGNIADQIRGRTRYSAQNAYDAAADVERERRDAYSRDHPIANVGAIAASILTSGRPATTPATATALPRAVAPVRANPIKTGAQLAAVNAPLAVARQEGDLVERLPGAALETGITFGLGAGAQQLSNVLTSRISPQAQRLQQFEEAGVRPTFAAVAGNGAASVTKAVAENPIAGIPTRARLQNSLDDTRDAANRLSGELGTPAPTPVMGERIQEGVESFAKGGSAATAPNAGTRALNRAASTARATPTRQMGFNGKSQDLYNQALGRLENIEAARIARPSAKQAAAGPYRVSTSSTLGTLGSIQSRVGAPNVAAIVNDPLIARIANAVRDDAGQLRLGDLRQLRTWVREAQRNPQLRQGVDDAALQRLEGALTDDIMTTARQLGGKGGVQDLQRADAYYRAGMNRIRTALQPFASAKSGENAFQRVILAAREGATGDVQKLLSLKRSLPPEDWGDLAATIAANLGKPTRGAANALEDGAFSVNTFVTNYAALSERGRSILFGSVGGGGKEAQQIHAAMENLARVAGMQKAVEAAANRSNSSVAGQSVAMLGGLVTAPAPTLGIIGSLAVTGEVMTNPSFVRWLASVPAAGQTVGGLRQHVAQLGRLAAANPELQPVYEQLVRDMAASVAPKRDEGDEEGMAD